MNPKVHLLEAIQLSEIEAARAFFVEYEGTLPFDPGYQVFDDEISGVSGPLGEPFIWRRLTACRSVPKDSAGPHRMPPRSNSASFRRHIKISALAVCW